MIDGTNIARWSKRKNAQRNVRNDHAGSSSARKIDETIISTGKTILSGMRRPRGDVSKDTNTEAQQSASRGAQ